MAGLSILPILTWSWTVLFGTNLVLSHLVTSLLGGSVILAGFDMFGPGTAVEHEVIFPGRDHLILPDCNSWTCNNNQNVPHKSSGRDSVPRRHYGQDTPTAMAQATLTFVTS